MNSIMDAKKVQLNWENLDLDIINKLSSYKNEQQLAFVSKYPRHHDRYEPEWIAPAIFRAITCLEELESQKSKQCDSLNDFINKVKSGVCKVIQRDDLSMLGIKQSSSADSADLVYLFFSLYLRHKKTSLRN